MLLLRPSLQTATWQVGPPSSLWLVSSAMQRKRKKHFEVLLEAKFTAVVSPVCSFCDENQTLEEESRRDNLTNCNALSKKHETYCKAGFRAMVSKHTYRVYSDVYVVEWKASPEEFGEWRGLSGSACWDALCGGMNENLLRGSSFEKKWKKKITFPFFIWTKDEEGR